MSNPESPCTLTGVSDTQRTPEDETWRLPKHVSGEDDLWDRLGEDWQAVDGVRVGVRVYVQWEHEEEGRVRLSGLCVAGENITTDTLRRIPVSRLENLHGVTGFAVPQDQFVRELAPLVRRKDEDPDEFSGRVAYYYRVFAAISSRPAKEIAQHSNVPVGTVRGWIREARLRGKLPPGTRGRAG